MRNTTTLDTIPHELLENIALFAATSDPLGPPHELVPLLLVNRRLHAALASASNPHLHARIFAAKFDTAALVRRLGPDASARTTSIGTGTGTGTGIGGATRATKLAAELRRRCVQLKRLKAGVGCTIGAFAALAGGGGACLGGGTGTGTGAGGGLTEEGMRAMHEMLWTAYLMMLENDGKNERQLREYARVDLWLRKFWFAEEGASCAQIAIRDNAWPPNNDLSAVTMWLFWFLLRPGAFAFLVLQVFPPPIPVSDLVCCPPFFSFFVFFFCFFGFPRVDRAFLHISRTCARQTRGILRAERRRVSGRYFHIEAAGSWGTPGMSCLRVSSFAYDVLFLLIPSFSSFLPSSLRVFPLLTHFTLSCSRSSPHGDHSLPPSWPHAKPCQGAKGAVVVGFRARDARAFL